jgi:hypothetical protein
MANTLISPGVLSIENDQSFITQQPVTVGAAIIGPTVKGPVEVPTICTSYSDYQNKFGTTFVSGSQVFIFYFYCCLQLFLKWWRNHVSS